jgi:hypothetical protein
VIAVDVPLIGLPATSPQRGEEGTMSSRLAFKFRGARTSDEPQAFS